MSMLFANISDKSAEHWEHCLYLISMSTHKNHKILMLVLVVICSYPNPIVVIGYIQTTPIGKGRHCETRHWEHKSANLANKNHMKLILL